MSQPTHVVVVKYGVVPSQPFAFSDQAGAAILAKDAKRLGYRDARVLPIGQYQTDRRVRSESKNSG